MSNKVNSQLEAIGSQALRVAPRPAPTPKGQEKVAQFAEAESYEGHPDPKPRKTGKKREASPKKRAGSGTKKTQRKQPSSSDERPTVGVHFVVPKDVHKKLKLVCLLEDRTMSEVISELAEDYVYKKRDLLDLT